MIEKKKRYIETTIRIFESYGVDMELIKNIANTYNDIAKKEVHRIEPPLLNDSLSICCKEVNK